MSGLNVLVGDTVTHLRNFKPEVFDCIVCQLPRSPYFNSSVPYNHETLSFYYKTLSEEFQRLLTPQGTIWLVGKYDPLIYASYFLKECNFYFINQVCIVNPTGERAASRSLENLNLMAYWMKPYKHSPHTFNGSELSDIWDLEPKGYFREMARISCDPQAAILLPFYDQVAFNSLLSVSPNVFTIKGE